MNVARTYQGEAVDAVVSQFKTVQSTLALLATGLGKSFIAVEVSKRFLPGRTLFLTDREELVWQVRQTYLEQGIDCEVEKAELAASVSLFSAPVVIATVQTLKSGKPDAKRMKRFKPEDFALVIYDEAHGAPAAGNKAIVDYFKQNKDLKVLCLTATGDRADGVGLGSICESTACNYDILFGIENGWLVEPVPKMVTLGALDIRHVRVTRSGDFNESDLSAVLEQEEPVAGLVQPTLETMFKLPENALRELHPREWKALLEPQWPPIRTIVFTVSVKQAEMACNGFNRVWPGIAGWVCGKTHKESRRDLFRQFRNGDVYILCNVGVTTQGYDNPNVGMIVMGAPTLSRLKAAQQVGRVTRPLKGLVDTVTQKESRLLKIALSSKPRGIVLDFVGNFGKHKLVTVGDLLAGKNSPEAVRRVMERVAKAKEPMKVKDLIAEEELKIQKEIEERRLMEEAKKVELVARVRYTTQQVNPFSLEDDTKGANGSWRRQNKLSPGERKTLKQAGYTPDELPYQEGRRLVRETFWRWRNKMATPGQIKKLKEFYPKELDYSALKGDRAKKILDLLQHNQWRRLPLSAIQT